MTPEQKEQLLLKEAQQKLNSQEVAKQKLEEEQLQNNNIDVDVKKNRKIVLWFNWI